MKRYFIYLAYNGGNYCGWQTQPNGTSVQESIEKALATLLRMPIPIVGAGRTDAGVHARTMVAHFDHESGESGELNTALLVEKLNRILPKDIAIHRIKEVATDAHARFDATSRLYRYYVTTRKDPYLHHLKYKIHGAIGMDAINAMNACADVLFEYIDFTSFSKLHTDVKTNNCKITHACWERIDIDDIVDGVDGEDYVFTIRADRFLRNMVRSIVGTLLEAGRGKLTPDGMRKIIETKDRCAAGTSVPGHALFLEEIEYDPKIEKK